MSKPTTLRWLTNDPNAAAKLRAIDAAYWAARDAAAHLPLALKIIAYREAEAVSRAAYDAVLREGMA
jgi:hypothetical protein